MSKKVYRSAQGKNIDIGALQLTNESVRAVGNMGVNARGDKVNAKNVASDTRNKLVAKHYNKQTKKTNVSDDIVYASRKELQNKQSTAKVNVADTNVELDLDSSVMPGEKQMSDDPLITDEYDTEKQVENNIDTTLPKTEKQRVGGLADAIAKAKSIKQEPLKTPRQQAQEKKGVKRI